MTALIQQTHLYYLLDESFSSQQNLYKSILFTLVQNALFSERAMDMHELCDTCDKSVPTIKKAIYEINEKQELITKYRDGHKIVFKINLEELEQQFNGFIRFLIDDLKEVREEKDEEKKNKRIEKILENLQSTLED